MKKENPILAFLRSSLNLLIVTLPMALVAGIVCAATYRVFMFGFNLVLQLTAP